MSQRLNHESAYPYVELAHIAALNERAGDWNGASRFWVMGKDYTRLPESRLWARSRARYCGREAGQGLGYVGRSVLSLNQKSLTSTLILTKNARGTVKDDECMCADGAG